MTRYVRATGVLWRRTHDSVVALAPASREVSALAGSAQVLWELLDEPLAAIEVAELMADIYRVSVDEVTGSLQPVLDELVARRLLTVAVVR